MKAFRSELRNSSFAHLEQLKYQLSEHVPFHKPGGVLLQRICIKSSRPVRYPLNIYGPRFLDLGRHVHNSL